MPVVFANVLQPLIDVFEAILVFLHDNVTHSWGAAIVLLTVVVRAALIPLTLRQFKSMQGLQKLSPEIKKLQAKYKEDKERLNQEMMKFYKENKVNPLGSCLPLLAQMPVFIALFYLLRGPLRQEICGQDRVSCGDHFNKATEALGGFGERFLFIPDLTNEATGAVLVTLMVLYVVSQLVSSLLMSVSADRNQRLIAIGLPLVFVMFIINFPTGLIVYWITTNLWTIVQQYIVRKTVGPLRPATPDADKAADDKGNKGDKGDLGQGGKLAPAGASAGGGAARAAAPPPRSPRKKKKRSGRRR